MYWEYLLNLFFGVLADDGARRNLSSTRTDMALMRKSTMLCTTVSLDGDPRSMISGMNMFGQLRQNLMAQIRKPVLMMMMVEQLESLNHQSQSPICTIRWANMPGNRLGLE